MDDHLTIEHLKNRLQTLESAASENGRLKADLEECRENYRLFVENTAEIIAILDMNLRFTHVSPAIKKIRGFTPEEIMAQSLEEGLTPDSMARATTVFLEELQLEASGTADPDRVRILELEEYHKDGLTVWMEVSLSFLRDRNGKATGILALSRDITKRKQAERELQMFREVVGNSSNAIGISTPEGKHFYQNEAFENLFGPIGDNPTAVYVDKTVAEEVFNAIKAGKRWGGEVRMTAKDRGVRDILLRAYANKDKDGRVTGLVGIHTDITEHKQWEKKLRQSEERFRTIFNEAPIGIVLADSRTGILYEANAAYSRITGRPSDQLKQTSWMQIAHPDDVSDALEQIKNMDAGKTPGFQSEKRIIKPDGGVVWINLTVAPLKAGGRVLPFHLGMMEDITERRRTEAKRVELEGQLHQAQKMESVGRLAGGVAHDFNNMLSVILGFTELAMTKTDPSQTLFADLAEIRKAAARSSDLTRQLLAFARKQTIAPEILDLNETVSGMINMLRRLIGEDIDLAWRPGMGLWPVHMDPTQIDQILANLCVNARDAISDVGAITIETKNTMVDEAFCMGKPECCPGEYVCLAVSDNGKGMDPETLKQIFEPFFTTKAQGKGTGLGLATVYGIARQNSGFVDVHSRPGRGTTFDIYLPRHRVKAGRVEKEGPATPAPQGHETILLVEDEPAILEMTTQMLEMNGYQVLAAGTPGQAMRLAREHAGEIHLLMTDIVMPEMNGRDLAKNLLSLYPELKRLFMSGYTADVIAHHGVLEDGVHFIQKPFTIKHLRAKVREALEG